MPPISGQNGTPKQCAVWFATHCGSRTVRCLVSHTLWEMKQCAVWFPTHCGRRNSALFGGRFSIFDFSRSFSFRLNLSFFCTVKFFFYLCSRFEKNAPPDSVAQLVEHNTFNVGVLGSSPSGITTARKSRQNGGLFFCLPACATKAEPATGGTAVPGISAAATFRRR